MIPIIENHLAPFFSIKGPKASPNFAERKATINTIISLILSVINIKLFLNYEKNK